MAALVPAKQRQFAVEVVRRLRSSGHEAYWAGGCVRDQLLGRTAKDYDVATAARPEEIRELFGHRRTLALGAAFGVITVVGPKDAGQIEVTTFREDATYSDGRHPDAVVYSTAQHDVLRRDFTINGLLFDPITNEVLDFVGGQRDLEARLVRAIGDPRQRFAEDKLRLLRAVRFAATFDFALEEGTHEAIRDMAGQIGVVSAERITAELRLMLLHDRRGRAVELLRETGLLAHVLPELPPVDTSVETRERWVATLRTLELLQEPDFAVALAALLRPLVSAQAAEQIFLRWKLSNKDAHLASWLIEKDGALAHARATAWPKLQRLLISEEIRDLVKLDRAAAEARGAPTDDLDYCEQLLRQDREVLNPRPLLSGKDLIEQGIPAGKHYQRLLEAVRDAQLEGAINSRAEALALAKKLWESSPREA